MPNDKIVIFSYRADTPIALEARRAGWDVCEFDVRDVVLAHPGALVEVGNDCRLLIVEFPAPQHSSRSLAYFVLGMMLANGFPIVAAGDGAAPQNFPEIPWFDMLSWELFPDEFTDRTMMMQLMDVAESFQDALPYRRGILEIADERRRRDATLEDGKRYRASGGTGGSSYYGDSDLFFDGELRPEAHEKHLVDLLETSLRERGVKVVPGETSAAFSPDLVTWIDGIPSGFGNPVAWEISSELSLKKARMIQRVSSVPTLVVLDTRGDRPGIYKNRDGIFMRFPLRSILEESSSAGESRLADDFLDKIFRRA